MNTLLESPKRSKTLRFAFISTTVSGVSYYRMASFAWSMRRWPRVQTHVWPYRAGETVQNPWQVDMQDNEPRVPVKSLNAVLTIRQYLDWLCETSDVIVWQALDFPHSLEIWEDLRLRHQKPFLMEIDDYVTDIPVGNEAFDQYRPGSTRYRVVMEQMHKSDALIVSTPYLAKQYAEINDHIYVMPNSIDFKEWSVTQRTKRSERIRIGWIGGGTHSADLEMIRPIIENLIQKYENVWFYCIHGVPNSFKEMPKVYWTHKWANINLYPRFLASFKFDIGVAPLVDNNFNRGKSNLRWLEYSALRIPTVASALPDFTRVIVDGKNGCIEDWQKNLEELIENESYRKELGQNAYLTVRDQFNISKTSTAYMRLLKGISNGDFPAH